MSNSRRCAECGKRTRWNDTYVDSDGFVHADCYWIRRGYKSESDAMTDENWEKRNVAYALSKGEA